MELEKINLEVEKEKITFEMDKEESTIQIKVQRRRQPLSARKATLPTFQSMTDIPCPFMTYSEIARLMSTCSSLGISSTT